MTGQERDDLARLLYERHGGVWDPEDSCFEWDRNLYREDADAILASDWLRERDQRIKAEARALGHAEGASDTTHYPRNRASNPLPKGEER